MRRGLSLLLLVALASLAVACVDPATTGHDTPAEQLTVYTAGTGAPPGTRWQGGYLEVVTPGTVLERVHIKGGVDHVGGGQLTVRDSIIEGGASWMILNSRGGTLLVEDSTLRWRDGTTVNPDKGNGSGVIQAGGTNLTVRRSNLSGNPDGIQCSGQCLVEDTWIHDLAMVGVYPENTHNDGIQFYGGNLTVRNSMLNTGAQSPYSNAAVFLQGGSLTDCITVEGDTWLNGGGYTFYGQVGRIDLNDTRFGPDHLWGEKLIEAPAVEVADC
jgi:hypothetical protein